MRRLLVLLLLLAALAGPAAADDIVEIDERLADAGLTEAYVEVFEGETGNRAVVDLDPGGTADRAAYEEQARTASRIVWEHLEVRLEAVDVQPSYGVPWLDDSLPPTVSVTRRDLEAAFGERPPALDEETDAYAGLDEDVDEELAAGEPLGGVALGIGLALLALVVVAVVAIVLGARRRDRRAEAAWGGAAWGGAASGGAPPSWPVPPAAPVDPRDPWQPPAR